MPAVACASCGVSEIPIVGEDKAAEAALSAKFGIKQFHVVHISDSGLLKPLAFNKSENKDYDQPTPAHIPDTAENRAS